MARTRPCTQSARGRGRPCTDCARPPSAVYKLNTAVHGSCTWSVRVPNTAVYAAGTRQNTAGYAARTRPCTYRIHGRTRAVSCTVYTAIYTAVFTARVHGRVPCTYHVHGRAWSIRDPNTAVYTVVYPVHGRVYGPCTRPCTVYMHVLICGLCIRPSTAVYRLRKGHVHGPFMTRTRRRPPVRNMKPLAN